MKERSILFSGPMVRAILEGRKTQTRRMLRHSPQPPRAIYADNQCRPVQINDYWGFVWECDVIKDYPTATHKCPYGVTGDRLWVKETFWHDGISSNEPMACAYREDGEMPDYMRIAGERWKPPIFMPHWASRITLEIEAVRVERLNGISEEDATSEGVTDRDGVWGVDGAGTGLGWETPCGAYRELWESINGPGSWDANPWVWVIQFRKL